MESNRQYNPLAQYTRRAARYVKIPSCGQFYTKGINLSDNGELAVYPMTAKDELVLKSPDALLNGEAVKSVLRNCIPDVTDPGEIPTIDLDTILVAIRMATYGDDMEMEVEHQCDPTTKHESKINVNLGQLLDTVTYYNGEPAIIVMPNRIQIEIRPYTMADRNRIAMASWEQMSRMQMLDSKADVDLTKKMKESGISVNKLIEITLDIIANSVIKVTTPEGDEVTDRKFIKEWVVNLEKSDFNLIDAGVKDLMGVGIAKEVHVKCDNCGGEHDVSINFNPTDFFE
jgi:hypothetical protein